MDLISTANDLKGLPDQALQQELMHPSGLIPSYLVLAEAQRRQTLRSASARDHQQQQSGTVYDDVIRSMMARQPPQGLPPAPAGMVPTPSAPPAATLGSTPPQNFRTPQQLAVGGLVGEDEDDETIDVPTLREAMIGFEGSRKPGSRGYRNNNPGNLKFANQPEATGADPQGFAIFPSIDAGQRAMDRQLRKNVGRQLTMAEMIEGKPGVYPGWAPAAAGNDPDRYINYLADQTGYHPGHVMREGLPAAAAPPPSPPPAEPGAPAASLASLTPPPIEPDIASPSLPEPPTPPTPPPQPPAVAAALPTQPDMSVAERYFRADQAKLRDEVERLKATYAKQAKPNFWRMLGDFGTGMAGSASPYAGVNIGAGVQAMHKGQVTREEAARRTQLQLLGVDLKLDDQARQYQQRQDEMQLRHQERLDAIKEKATQQAETRARLVFNDASRTPGAVFGSANDPPPGPGFTFVPNTDNPAHSVWLPPTRQTVTDANMAKILGVEVGASVPYPDYLRARYAAMETGKKKIEAEQKPTPALSSQYRIAAKALNLPDDSKQWTPEDAKKMQDFLHPEIKMTPDQIRFHAEAYLKGVPLPPLGMGVAGARLRGEILGTAADISHDVSLAASRAAGRGDSSALEALTKQITAVEAFEQTASKNLDLMLSLGKRVMDVGSPWINKPFRKIEVDKLGDAELAAYNAARQVALTEIAKITNNPSLAGVLSDSARAEIKDLIPEEATIEQIFRIAQVLKQDMANRQQSLYDERDKLMARLNQKPGASPAPAATAPATTGGPPLIKTKEEYDRLPSGTIYQESNGKTYRKP
jgi:hypothetical protein